MHRGPERPDGSGNKDDNKNDDSKPEDAIGNAQDDDSDDDTVLVATLALESELWPDDDDDPEITQEVKTLDE